MMSARLPALLLVLFFVAGCSSHPGIPSGSGRVPTAEEAEQARTLYQEGANALQSAYTANRRAAPGLYAQARKSLEKCLRLDPGNLDAQVKLVEVLGTLREEKDLLERLRAVLAVDSLHVKANEELANRTYGIALAFVTVGVLDPVKPGDVMSSSQRTLLKAQGVRFRDLPALRQEARTICERLLRITPNSPKYLCALGAIANLEGDYAGATEIYYRVQRRTPDFLQQNDFHNTVFAVSRENRIFVSATPRSFLQNLGGRTFRLIR
jgi:tetratricopeptide (TPR) repeat protein